jgi:hypothetical protein
MIQEILENSKKDQKFIGVWVYNDTDGFWTGYVEDYTADYVYLRHFTKYGKPDGIILERIDNIQSIDFEDNYSEALQYLVENHHLLDKQDEIFFPIPTTDNWQYEVLQNYVGNLEIIVRLQLDDDNEYTGLVHKISEEFIVINCIGTEGHDEFFSLYKLSDIKTIRINDMDARKRLLLYNWRK